MKPLAFLLLIVSCVAAFSLSVLAYMLTTGDSPFEIPPLLRMPEPRPAATATVTPASRDPRATETAASDIFAALSRKAEKLAEEEKELADRKAAAEELITHAAELQKRMIDTQAQCTKLLDMIEAEEEQNLKNLAKLIENTESKAAASMIGEMTPDRAARIVYFMNARKAAELLATLIKVNPEKAKFAADMTTYLQRLSNNPSIRDRMAAAGEAS